MKNLLITLTFIAWALVVAFGMVGIASIFLAIWQQSDQWVLTALSCIALSLFGGIGASALCGLHRRSHDRP